MATKDKKKALIIHIEKNTHVPVPEALKGMEEKELKQLSDYLDSVLNRERAGMDGLFQSMSQTMKYIPNFLLQSLAQKFIEPPIAARITVRLTLKQATGVAAGLPPEYVAECALYLDNPYAAEFLSALPKKHRALCIQALMERYPLKALDVLAYADNAVLTQLKPTNLVALEQLELNSQRLSVLRNLQEQYG